MAGLISNITLLPDELILYIVEKLDDIDYRIAFAYSCSRFREICHHNPRVMRKVDLSKCIVRRKEDPVTMTFFRDKQMVQNIRELNFNNHRVLNWQMDGYLEEFIMACCPQLEALHVLNCGMSLKSLHCILQQATKLTVLSFSVMDLSQKDIDFILHHGECAKGIFLENIKSLHIETLISTPHLQILRYLVLYCCKCLEELEIYVWSRPRLFELETQIDSGFIHQLSIDTKESFQHLHSLTLQVDDSNDHYSDYTSEIFDLVTSVIKMKSHRMKWKKFWISPPIDAVALFDKCGPDVISSVEILTTKVHSQVNVKDLFQTINDRAVRNLQIQFTYSINRFPMSVARIGGDALQCLSLSSSTCHTHHDSGGDVNIPLNVLFSSCRNITELDLSGFHFQNNICKALSSLRHLVKLDVRRCAIVPNGVKDRKNQGNQKLLSLVENCPDVTGFVVRGCEAECFFLHTMVNDDLLPLAKWRKLESLACIQTVFNLVKDNEKRRIKPKQDSTIFLDEVVEKCKFLSTLMIQIQDHDEVYPGHHSYINFLQSAKQIKHLVLDMEIHWESRDFWNLLSCATNLERLCLKSFIDLSINIAGAVNMLKSLPRLHVFHVHYDTLQNGENFYKHMVKMLEEEKSDRFDSFEFFMAEIDSVPEKYWVYKKVLPMNIGELCSYLPSIALPKV